MVSNLPPPPHIQRTQNCIIRATPKEKRIKTYKFGYFIDLQRIVFGKKLGPYAYQYAEKSLMRNKKFGNWIELYSNLCPNIVLFDDLKI